MNDLSKAQQRLFDSIENVYPEERFHVSMWPHLFITNGRGSRVETKGVKVVTWHAISDRFTRVDQDHLESWFTLTEEDDS